jgi:hypothetical protein
MPNRDGTGPYGNGPFSGRCRGYGARYSRRLEQRELIEDEPTHQDLFDAIMEIRERIEKLEQNYK